MPSITIHNDHQMKSFKNLLLQLMEYFIVKQGGIVYGSTVPKLMNMHNAYRELSIGKITLSDCHDAEFEIYKHLFEHDFDVMFDSDASIERITYWLMNTLDSKVSCHKRSTYSAMFNGMFTTHAVTMKVYTRIGVCAGLKCVIKLDIHIAKNPLHIKLENALPKCCDHQLNQMARILGVTSGPTGKETMPLVEAVINDSHKIPLTTLFLSIITPVTPAKGYYATAAPPNDPNGNKWVFGQIYPGTCYVELGFNVEKRNFGESKIYTWVKDACILPRGCAHSQVQKMTPKQVYTGPIMPPMKPESDSGDCPKHYMEDYPGDEEYHVYRCRGGDDCDCNCTTA